MAAASGHRQRPAACRSAAGIHEYSSCDRAPDSTGAAWGRAGQPQGPEGDSHQRHAGPWPTATGAGWARKGQQREGARLRGALARSLSAPLIWEPAGPVVTIGQQAGWLRGGAGDLGWGRTGLGGARLGRAGRDTLDGTARIAEGRSNRVGPSLPCRQAPRGRNGGKKRRQRGWFGGRAGRVMMLLLSTSQGWA